MEVREKERLLADKYLLAEFLTNTCLAAELNCLELLGLDAAKLKQLRAWAADRSVTLRLSLSETCTFNREQSRDIDSATKSETNSTLFGKSTHKVVTTVTEYFWDFEAAWELTAFRGNAPQSADDRLVLRGRCVFSQTHHVCVMLRCFVWEFLRGMVGSAGPASTKS